MDYAGQAGWLAGLLARTPGWPELRARHALDDDTGCAILDAAAAFAARELAPLDARADRDGCRLEDGRARTPEGYDAAWRALAREGWLAMDLPNALGGQGLPLALQACCQSLFDRACTAFMMGPSASRAAAHLLLGVADPATRDLWVPRLAAGDWAGTICISEPGAGSDVGRVRTRAARDGAGWRIDGEKVWISFGDQDVTERIGHMALARTSDAPGTRGLSLFLVPDRDEAGANGVAATRVEDKLGLHGSPTCALSFAGARATLLGQEGRGVPQLFRMIKLMRLQTGCQGLGLAAGALAVARSYAGERRQGGDPAAPPVAIASHADMRRMLLEMEARVAALAAAILELAVALDRCEDPDCAAFAAWLLPLVKTFGGETAFGVASDAIQVLGGAGYTRDWPLERVLRDARVLTIYEGTTGMQARDFLFRRLLRDEGRGGRVFLERARQVPDPTLVPLLDRFEALTEALTGTADAEALDWAADGYLRAAWCAVTGYVLLRDAGRDGPGAAAALRLGTLPEEMALAVARSRAPAG